MQYVDSNKKVVLLITRNKGRGQLTKDRPFSYGRILRLDYEDPDFENLVLLVECSKGVRKMWVSEDLLVKDSCGPKSFQQEIAITNNLITSLRPYIQGHVSLKDRLPSPKKVATKRNVHSRPTKKKKRKLSDSESESSSSTDDEETRTTPGAELAYGVLSSDQNKIGREIMQKKLECEEGTGV